MSRKPGRALSQTTKRNAVMNVIDRRLHELLPECAGMAQAVSERLYHDHHLPTRREIIKAAERELRQAGYRSVIMSGSCKL